MSLGDQAAERPLSPKQLKRILRNRHEYGGAGEARWLELKRNLASQGNRRREDIVKLLGAVVSMYNSGGGYVVFGVSDKGDLYGVDKYTIDLLDPARIRDLLHTYSPSADIQTRRTVVDYHTKTYAAIWVEPTSRAIVFDKPGDYVDEHNDQQQAFRDGVLYTRDSGGRVRATQNRLDEMVERFVEDRLSEFLAKIDQVAHLPPEADLLASHPQDPNRAYRLTAAGEGVPVHVVKGSEEAAVSLREVLREDIPFEATEDEVGAAVRLWKTRRRDHRLSREVCFEWYLKRNNINWDKDSSTLCLISACSEWGYPLYWARWLAHEDMERLRTVIESFVEDPSHPATQYAPYLAGAFLKEGRADILNRARETRYAGASDAADKVERLLGDSRKVFLLNARGPGTHIRVEDDEYPKEKLFEDRDLAISVLDRVVERRLKDTRGELSGELRPGLSGAGHQLDLLAHAPRELD